MKWFGVALMVLLLLVSGPATAQRSNQDLGRLDCITNLKRPEVERLRRTLRGDGRHTGDAFVRTTLQTLAQSPGWDAANLAELVYPTEGLGEGNSAQAGNEKLIYEWLSSLVKAATQAKPADGCKMLRKLLRERANNPAEEDYTTAANACFAWPSSKQQPRAQVVFTHPDVDRLLVVTTAGVLDLRQEHSLDVSEARAFLVPVADASPMTLRAFAGRQRTTHAKLLRSAMPIYVMFEEDRAACVDLEYSVDADERVDAYLAGTPLHEGPNSVFVPSGMLETLPVSLRVLSRREVTESLAVRDLSWAEIEAESKRSGCFKVRFDLTRQPTDQAVAIVSARVGASCIGSGLDEADLQSHADQTLRRIGWQSRPARQWAALVGDFSRLMNELDRGKEVGAPRGNLDQSLRIEQGASEAKRQGFGKLLSLEVGCAPGLPTTQVSVRGTVLDLDNLKPQSDKLLGLDLSKAQHSKVAVVPGVSSLDSGLTAVLSQLHDKNAYVRLEPSTAAWRFGGGARITVFAYLPSAPRHAPANGQMEEADQWSIKVQSIRLNEDEQYLCQAANDRAADVHAWWHDRLHADRGTQAVTLSPGVEVTRTVTLQPSKPGVHMIRALLSKSVDGANLTIPPGENPTTVAYQCISMIEPRLVVSIDLGYAGGTSLRPSKEARRDDLGYGRLLGSILYQQPYRHGLMVGASLGYANAVHTLAAPPTWELGQAGATPMYDAQGELPTAWTRQSILFGPIFVYRLRAVPCQVADITCGDISKRLGLVFRFAPLLDVGKISAEAVAAGLEHFTQRSGGLDLDLTALLDAGVEIGLTPSTSLYGVFGTSFVGWDDFALGGRDQRSARGQITYDAHTVIGFSLGVMASP